MEIVTILSRRMSREKFFGSTVAAPFAAEFRHRTHRPWLADFGHCAWWPGAPVVTAMAIIALGATYAAIDRYNRGTLMLPVVILQATTYAALYGLFIGATLHAGATRPTASLSGWTLLDLAFSTIPMAVALQHIVSCLRRRRLAAAISAPTRPTAPFGAHRWP